MWSADQGSRHAVLAGGGTGGHVFPALAVADELAARGWRVSWIGRNEGMERRIVEGRGLPYHALPALAVVGRGPIKKAAALATLARSALKARRLMVRLQARVVLGTGGYVSAPTVVGARLARRPALLMEPNVEAGAANRWLSRWARGAAVAFPEAAAGLRCPVRHTGVPVHRGFFQVEPDLPASGPARLLVLGGSQGARQLNQILPLALEAAVPRLPDLEVLHQVGEGHVEETRAAYAARRLGTAQVEIQPFLEDVAAAMGWSHLVVSRAGAVTLAEICAAGRAALLVPLELAGGHQRKNAERLLAAGGAEILWQETTPETFAKVLTKLLADRRRLEAMGRALRRLARPQAAQEIADLLIETAEAA
ncbi:MAG: undecaprenyldiphospho-muramoylpentapeptide beta-N-acetylglucosaminyltransferase [Thermoanaerobaculia bacterium]